MITKPPPPYPNSHRWPIALAGTLLQLCLGTVYAWSFFQNPIMQKFGWSNESVTWVFSLAICFLGLSAAWAGLQLKNGRLSPRSLAMTGGVLFAIGHLLAAAALWQGWLWLLWLGYGVIGGIGLGLGYVVPVATTVKWFPDKKGFITGMVVMGFGFGALLMSKLLAPFALRLFGNDLAPAFAAMGCLFAILAPAAGALMRNPPSRPDSSASLGQNSSPEAPLPGRASFVMLWLLFFCNIFTGISIISFQSPLLQDLLHLQNPGTSAGELAAAGATLIACSAIFNGLGRFLWGSISDKIGQARTFSLMLAGQIVIFALLPQISSPVLFGAAVCYVLLCYGGGFGVIPSYVLALFGEKRMALYYGAILTAWSAAGIAGPKFMAWLRDHYSNAAGTAFYFCAGLLIFGLVLSVLIRNPAAQIPNPNHQITKKS